ncbi:phosphate signaling complex PhoU family protein [Amycolatopsis sp. NPDC098790]|uniref:phosphate signaling complex PhoU family protein n=1 Tax=Amycolatopsis sp. NPDC098790 TaxID=3363939 RepID=UPI00381F8250
MREGFRSDLQRLTGQLAEMCDAAASAVRHATAALVNADLVLAQQVIADDDALDVQRARCEEDAYALLALQAPVAGDLRRVLAVVYCADKVERMGDLAAHIADTARFAHPGPAVPADLAPTFERMGRLDAEMAERVAAQIRTGTDGFAELRQADETVDALHADLLATITGGKWQHDQRAAVTAALTTRFYERFADQAVSVAKRLDFASSGDLPQ